MGPNLPVVYMSKVIEATDQNFDKMLRGSRKVFVDFWAPWCLPCRKMDPVIERIANRHSSITFAKVNIEDQGDLATRYHISSIPAYVMFTNSNPSFSRIGAVSEMELEKMITEHAR
jgi:thioredoxin 1